MKKEKLFSVLIAVSVMSLIVSNIITNKQTELFGLAITCGSFLIPVNYVVNDVLAEVYGFKKARFSTLLAFACNLCAVIFFTLTLIAPTFETFENQWAFDIVLGSTPRILLASFTAYIVGSLINAKIMDTLHKRHGEKHLFGRCLLSTIVGEVLDMTVFTVIAFLGVLPLWVIGEMIMAASVVKICVEIILYPLITKHVIKYARQLED